jgi:hypothetical protein
VGETSPEPRLEEDRRLQDLRDPHKVEDIHATVLKALSVDYEQELETPIGRPMVLSEGRPIGRLLEA